MTYKLHKTYTVNDNGAHQLNLEIRKLMKKGIYDIRVTTIGRGNYYNLWIVK